MTVSKRTADPLEGFHVTGYDPVTKTVTVEIHATILGHPSQWKALESRAEEIILGGPSVDTVTFVPRDGSVSRQTENGS